jgi:hypothetical protein
MGSDPNGLMVIELVIRGKLTNFQENVISKMKRLRVEAA